MRFRSFRKPITAVILMLSTASVTIGSFTQPASAGVPPALGPSIGAASLILGIGAITFAVVHSLQGDDNQKRSDFTGRMIEELNREYPDYNAVITHHGGSTAEGPGVVHDHVELPMAVGSCGYEVFLSPKGQPFKFVLNGDGGFINWAYGGDFNRDDNTLTAK